ncbi:MAG: aspartate dehydrogenase [Halobacteria archaeon]
MAVRVGLIGCGAIGRALARAVSRGEVPGARMALLFDADPARARSLAAALRPRPRVAPAFAEFQRAAPLDVAVEAASQEAAAEYAVPLLAAGRDLLVMSAGVLLRPRWLARAEAAARRSGARLVVPSGAVAGLDGLRAIRDEIESVALTTRKPPASLGLKVSRRRLLYAGPAREAVRRFPRNVNVAATLAAATLGGERTRVRLVAEPGLRRNIHEIEARGGFGRMAFLLENVPSPENPATSRLAIRSAVEALRGLAGGPVRVGS